MPDASRRTSCLAGFQGTVRGEGRGSALTEVFLPQGYLPANMERRKLTLQRKREEYFGFIQQYYDSRNEEHHQDTYRQVRAVCVLPGFLPWYSPLSSLLHLLGSYWTSLAITIRSLLLGGRAVCFCLSSYGY